MLELVATIILIISLFGMAAILWRKTLVLDKLSDNLILEQEASNLQSKKDIKKLNPFKNFSYEIFLQKLVSQIRILSLKADNKTFNWLQKLRQKERKKKIEDDNYWDELKKVKKSQE